jgi:hypothetical protein
VRATVARERLRDGARVLQAHRVVSADRYASRYLTGNTSFDPTAHLRRRRTARRRRVACGASVPTAYQQVRRRSHECRDAGGGRVSAGRRATTCACLTIRAGIRGGCRERELPPERVDGEHDLFLQVTARMPRAHDGADLVVWHAAPPASVWSRHVHEWSLMPAHARMNLISIMTVISGSPTPTVNARRQ